MVTVMRSFFLGWLVFSCGASALAQDNPSGDLQWLDTAANNSMSADDSLFEEFILGGEPVIGTTANLKNFHSHFAGAGASGWANYEFTGLMRFEDGPGDMGVTFLSDYDQRDAYYRLRRLGGRDFQLSAHPHGITLTGDTRSGVIPSPGVWYRFRIQALDQSKQTRILAKVWRDGTQQPSDWQIDCRDNRPERLRSGTVGLWSMNGGSRLWADLRVDDALLLEVDNTQAVHTIALGVSQPLLSPGQSAHLSVIGILESGGHANLTADVEFEFSDAGVVELSDGTAVLTAIADGTTEIRAIYDGLISAPIEVTVLTAAITPASIDWVDTAAGNSLSVADNLFTHETLAGQPVLVTESGLTNVHSHFMGAGSDAWSDYTFTGRMQFDGGGGGVGVTFLSDYDSSDSYYRIRCTPTTGFHLAPHPHGVTLSGDIHTGVSPQSGVWYRFRVQVSDTGTSSRILAKVWAEGDAEPASWQINAEDTRSNRRRAGTVGCWSMSDGTRLWSDLRVNGQALLGEPTNNPGPEPVQNPDSDNFELELIAESGVLGLGESTLLSAHAHFSDGSVEDVTHDVTFTVSNPAVLTVTSSPPRASALGAGFSSVACSLGGVSSSPLEIEVLAPEPDSIDDDDVAVTLQSLMVQCSDTSLSPGQSASLSVSGAYSDGTSADLTDQANWTLSNTASFQISSSSPVLLTATGTGNANVVATIGDLASAPLLVASHEVGDVPTLAPGAGFSGSTPVPGQNGSGPGADRKAIARFDVAPYQTFGDDFEIGVIAFHINGIDRVEFSADGGPWTPVYEMSLNPRTNAGEYWVNLRAQDCGLGKVEVRAIAYPSGGKPRLLPPLYLFADPNGTAEEHVRYISPSGSDSSGTGTHYNPFRSARKAARDIQAASSTGTADGGIIYCLAGNNVIDAGGSSVHTEDRYVTILPAPGLTRDDVFISSGGDTLETKLMRLVDVTITSTMLSGFSADEISSGDEESHLFAEGCVFQGEGPNTQVGSLGHIAETRYTGYYVIDSEIRDERHGLHRAALLRNIHCQNIGSDPFQNARFIVNCSVDGVQNNMGWHPDVIQWTQAATNVIIYGVHATNVKGQGIFAKPTSLALHDVALVNVLVEESASYKSEWEPNSNHLLIWNCSFIDHTFVWTGGNCSNVSIRNSYFHKLTGSVAAYEVDNNHFQVGTPRGTNATSGGTTASIFMDPSNDVFAPATGSVIDGPSRPSLVQNPLVPTDTLSNSWHLPASIGACEN